ncbi:MAG: alpha/beta hydrolase [Chloroflexi bacterium]|nr:alpha/beta hydrolase [Chloroflexota bacterium]
MAERRVTFMSDGLQLVGDLRVPDSATPQSGWPALVFTGPFSGVKEQVTGLYARRLTAAGFVTLAFDHRNFGESAGQPRQHEDWTGKLADLRDAASFLALQPEVNAERLGTCGICLGGGFALRFAAFDPRIRALACIAGGYNDPHDMQRGFGAEGYRAQLLRFANMAQRQFAGGAVEYMPAVAPAGKEAVMAGQEPYDYYSNERSASPGWRNQVTLLSIRELITADLAIGADFISPTPTLIVHGRTDAYCSPDDAARVYERAGQPKDILWLETTNHIDLYDNETYVGPAIARAISWFEQYL